MGRNLALRVGALASIVLAGCGESATAPVETQFPEIPPPAYAISDAVNAGNPHVYFLPPVVPNPTPTGTFDAALSPRVEICESDLTGCIGEPFAVFTSGGGVDQVRVVPEDEHYILNWDTGDWGLATDTYYRITVFQASFELGYVDVRVDGKGGGSNPGTGETFSLNDGRTLPLKVRIEEGAAAMAPARASTPDGSATVQAPPGALQQYEELTVESVDETTTELPDDGAALPGTVYDFGPDGLAFQEPVELALAYDPISLPAGVIESELRLFVAGLDGWELLPGGSVDLANNRVTGLTTHFSVFAILPGRVKKCQADGYGTLEEALADVGPGGTITACDGTHSVEGVVVDKPVTIQAEVGATPVFVTTTEPAALFIDGIASGSVVLDGLAFDFSTPHPAPDGANAYAVQAQNEYDQVVIRNTTFTIDPGSRGAVVGNASSVPTAALFVDNAEVSGGVFGIAALDIHAEVTNSLFTANSFVGVQFASSSATADGLIQGSTFVDCGTYCARGWGTQPMDIVGNTFGQCGAARCIGTTNGAQVNVTGNTFVQQILTGDPVPDPNNQIFVSASSTVTVTGNTFNGCAFFNCVEVVGVATISDNDFHHNPGQPEWEFSTIIGAFESIDATLDGNRVHSCGVLCYNIGNGANVTIRNETVTSLPGHGTDAIVTMHVFDNPAAPANTVVFEDNVITGSGTESGVEVWDTDLTLNGNVFTQVAEGLEVGTGLTHVTTVTGRDNVLVSSGTAVAIQGATSVDFRFNDITGQAIDIGSAGDGTSILTCNWWGTVDGPANVSGAPGAVYTPWALAPIAGTAASGCNGGS